MQIDLVQSGIDVPRLVLDHLQFDIGWQLCGDALQIRLGGIDDGDGAGPRLTPDLEYHRGYAIQPRHRALLFRAILGPADVPDPNRRAVDCGNHQVIERLGVGDATEGPQHLLLGAGGDVSTRHVDILANNGIAHRGDRQPIGGQTVGIDPYIDGTLQTADNRHLTYAGRALESHLHGLIRQLRQLTDRPIARQRHGQYRRRVVIGLLHDRWIGPGGKIAQDGGDAVADILRRHVDVACEVKRDDDDRAALPGNRPQLLDPLDRIDRFLKPLGDLGFDLLG